MVIKIRTRSTTTGVRNLQFRGIFSIAMFKISRVDFGCFSFMEIIARFLGGEECAKSCHISGCHDVSMWFKKELGGLHVGWFWEGLWSPFGLFLCSPVITCVASVNERQTTHLIGAQPFIFQSHMMFSHALRLSLWRMHRECQKDSKVNVITGRKREQKKEVRNPPHTQNRS